MKLTRPIVAVAVGAVVVVLWYVTVFGSQRTERSRLADRLEAAERRGQELRSSRDELLRFEKEYAIREAELARYAAMVPAEADVARFIMTANHAASSSGVNWVDFAPGQAVAGKGGAPTSIPVGVGVRGGYTSILDYVRRLETLERLVVIDSIRLAVADRRSATVELSASITSRIFTSGSVPARGDSAAPAASRRTASGERAGAE